MKKKKLKYLAGTTIVVLSAILVFFYIFQVVSQ